MMNLDTLKEKVSKVEAARRQLDTAIRLWFRGEDPVSVHTLACSAYQILNDICQSEELLYNSLLIKDDSRKEAIRILKLNCNFFKHANKDPDGVTEFNPASNEVFILFCCKALESIGIEPSIPRGAFVLYWMVTTDPIMLTEDGVAKLESIPVESRRAAASLPKEKFLSLYTYFCDLQTGYRFALGSFG